MLFVFAFKGPGCIAYVGFLRAGIFLVAPGGGAARRMWAELVDAAGLASA